MRDEANRKIEATKSPVNSPKRPPRPPADIEAARLAAEKRAADDEAAHLAAERRAADDETSRLAATSIRDRANSCALTTELESLSDLPPVEPNQLPANTACAHCRKQAAKASYMSGVHLAQRVRPDEAIKAFRAALDIDPSHRQATISHSCGAAW